MLFVSTPAFAVTYSNDVNVRFTFNSEINIVIDSADIEILDLAPGTSSDSNVVGITISTNNVVGYTASATVGNSTYNTTSMTHTNGVDSFTSIATDASQASLNTDNTWGYTTSLDNGSSWANLSGLPIYTETPKEIATTTSPANDAIKFKINAKASTSQTAGDYKNVINFTVVANVPPKTIEDAIDISDPAPPIDSETKLHTMQSMTEDVCDIVEAIDEQTRLTDTRDHKTYWVAKLKDGRCWMTQNLDFDIVNGGANINSANTDVPVDWEDVGNLTNTYATSDLTWEGSMERPESYDPGDVCWDGVITTDQFQTLSDRSEACNQSNNHYHIGNYYNWTAALAMSNSSSYSTSETDVEQSICPAGWTLPSSGSNTNSGSFAYLANETGLSSGDSGNVHVSPTYFSYGGSWQGNSVFVGYGGFYWSSTAKSNEYAAYSLNITPYIALPNGNSERFSGNLVRCVVRTHNP